MEEQGEPAKGRKPDVSCQALDLESLPRLVGIDLPLVCEDPERAMGFLGGHHAVALACRDQKRRLQVCRSLLHFI